MLIVIAGWVSAVLVFSSFFMKTMIPLRTVAVCSNVSFITYALLGLRYGVFGWVYPILVLHAALGEPPAGGPGAHERNLAGEEAVQGGDLRVLVDEEAAHAVERIAFRIRVNAGHGIGRHVDRVIAAEEGAALTERRAAAADVDCHQGGRGSWRGVSHGEGRQDQKRRHDQTLRQRVPHFRLSFPVRRRTTAGSLIPSDRLCWKTVLLSRRAVNAWKSSIRCPDPSRLWLRRRPRRAAHPGGVDAGGPAQGEV